MEKLLELLKGKKTYTVVAIATAVFALARLGYIDPAAELKFYEALGITAVATIRDAIK